MALAKTAAPAVETGGKQLIGRPFKPGQSGNPSGRPKGARNKLSEAFIEALATDFEANGRAVIEKVRTDRPHDYLKVVASILPKQLDHQTDNMPQRAVLNVTIGPQETVETEGGPR